MPPRRVEDVFTEGMGIGTETLGRRDGGLFSTNSFMPLVICSIVPGPVSAAAFTPPRENNAFKSSKKGNRVMAEKAVDTTELRGKKRRELTFYHINKLTLSSVDSCR